ncbi:MAG: hypothetical protein PT118_09665 [Aphanizomenon gracile PMC644.10]|nr:hypothetical protein [Aphanizomenon gracile PMC644.10]
MGIENEKLNITSSNYYRDLGIANSLSDIKNKKPDPLVKLSIEDEAKILEQKISPFLVGLNKLNEAVNEAEKFDPNKHFYPTIIIRKLDLDNKSILQIQQLFDILEENLRKNPRVIAILKQNLTDSMGINLVKIALDILSSQVDSVDGNDQSIKRTLGILKYRCTTFVKDYVLRLRHSYALGMDRDEYVEVFLLHSKRDIELQQLSAVATMLCAARGVRRFRSEAFQGMLSQSFGGIGVADEIVKRINCVVNNYVNFDKIPIINSLNIQEKYKAQLRDEFRYLQNIIAER